MMRGAKWMRLGWACLTLFAALLVPSLTGCGPASQAELERTRAMLAEMQRLTNEFRVGGMEFKDFRSGVMGLEQNHKKLKASNEYERCPEGLRTLIDEIVLDMQTARDIWNKGERGDSEYVYMTQEKFPKLFERYEKLSMFEDENGLVVRERCVQLIIEKAHERIGEGDSLFMALPEE